MDGLTDRKMVRWPTHGRTSGIECQWRVGSIHPPRAPEVSGFGVSTIISVVLGKTGALIARNRQSTHRHLMTMFALSLPNTAPASSLPQM